MVSDGVTRISGVDDIGQSLLTFFLRSKHLPAIERDFLLAYSHPVSLLCITFRYWYNIMPYDTL